MENTHKRPKLIDSYVCNGKTVECHLMPNGTLLILYFKTHSREIIESYNSIKNQMDEVGIANKFEEIKKQIMNGSAAKPVTGKRRDQSNLYAAT